MEPILGQLMVFTGNFAPLGWALCNGQLLQIRQYTALFSILGNYYGGDGKTTFALPDLRGRVVSHTDTTNNALPELGATYGTESNMLTLNQIPPHSHVTTGVVTVAASTTTDEDSESPIGSFLRSTPGVSTYTSTPNGLMGASTVTAQMAPIGGGTAVPNIQPTLAFNYCIAMEGIFPQRP